MLLGLLPIVTMSLSLTGGSGFLNILGLAVLVLIYFWALEGTRGPNRYGADPKGGDAPAPSTT
jgi:uncharacterized membrane protein YhaH (DUF805 family)